MRRIGASCGAAVPPGVDFTHNDFHFLNLLSDGTTITGVVEINPPPLAGDLAFDLATLVFYGYDHEELRRRILDRLVGLAGRQAARAYLAHSRPQVGRAVQVEDRPARPLSQRGRQVQHGGRDLRGAGHPAEGALPADLVAAWAGQ